MIDKKRGFTVIEVVLVLMLAGLIFLMVFIALPQMQRSQRDARRKTDMETFAQTLQKYTGANRGNLPKGTMSGTVMTGANRQNVASDSWDGFWNQYIDQGFADPKEGTYSLSVDTCTASGQKTDKNEEICNKQPQNFDATIYVFTGATCSEDVAVATNNSRKFVVVYRTESSGNYCFGV